MNIISKLNIAIHDRQGARREIYKMVEAPMEVSDNIREAIEEDLHADEIMDGESSLLDRQGNAIV